MTNANPTHPFITIEHSPNGRRNVTPHATREQARDYAIHSRADGVPCYVWPTHLAKALRLLNSATAADPSRRVVGVVR